MSAASRRHQAVHSVIEPTLRKGPRLADDSDAPTLSHVNLQIQSLESRLTRELPQLERTDRWSPRRTTAFVMVTCGGFWSIAGLLIVRAIH